MTNPFYGDKGEAEKRSVGVGVHFLVGWPMNVLLRVTLAKEGREYGGT